MTFRLLMTSYISDNDWKNLAASAALKLTEMERGKRIIEWCLGSTVEEYKGRLKLQ